MFGFLKGEFGFYRWISGTCPVKKNGSYTNYARIICLIAAQPGLSRGQILKTLGIKRDYKPTVDRGYYSCCFSDLLSLKLIEYDKGIKGYVAGKNFGRWSKQLIRMNV